MAYRPHASTLIEARAECERCAWSVRGKNAQALAARHFDKKLHRVRVFTTTELVYGAMIGKARGSKQKELAL